MGKHNLPANDMTPERRAKIYSLVVAASGIIIPLGAVLGVVIDDSIPTAITAVAGGLLLGGTGILAKRNVQ